MSESLYSIILKLAFSSTFASTILVTVNAILSAKEMGGTLGWGIKKIAAGTIFHSIVIATFLLLERGNRGLLTDEQLTLFFVVVGLLGSFMLIVGYWEIYRIAKKLKLFTV